MVEAKHATYKPEGNTQLSKLSLQTVKKGDILRLTAGKEYEAQTLDFQIIKSGNQPLCNLLQKDLEGDLMGPKDRVTLVGTGKQKPNPLTDDGLSWEIDWGTAQLGNEVFVFTTGKFEIFPQLSKIEVLQPES